MIVLAIVGSVTLAGNSEAQRYIEIAFDEFQPDRVVSGGADGIDTMAIEEAKRRGYTKAANDAPRLGGRDYKEYVPRVRRWYGEGGFKERNQMIADACTHLIRIVSSRSTTYGSGWTRDQAAEQKKFTREHKIVQ